MLTKRDISLHRQAKLSSSGRESNHFLLLLHLFLALPSYSKIWRFNLSLHAKRETSARILKLFGSVARKSDIFVKFVLNQVSRPSFSKRSFRGEWVCCALFHHQREKFAHFFGGESVFFRFLSSREICHLSHFRYTVCTVEEKSIVRNTFLWYRTVLYCRCSIIRKVAEQKEMLLKPCAKKITNHIIYPHEMSTVLFKAKTRTIVDLP